MKELTQFLRLLQWPVIFLGLALVLHDKWHVTAVTLALAFRNDLSAVLRRRRLAVRFLGFRCRLDGDAESPLASARNPPQP